MLALDLKGKKFGNLIVLHRAPNKGRHVVWLCRCSCGKKKEIEAGRLGRVKSCGCRSGWAESLIQDLTGCTYGCWVVLSRVEDGKKGPARWRCRCLCGVERVLVAGSLTSGNSKSCGCRTRTGIGSRPTQHVQRLPFGTAAQNAVLRRYKMSANYRSLVWALSDEEFLALTQERCEYCGVFPQQEQRGGTHSGKFIYNGVDRKNNVIGYTLENCVPCCRVCNHAKKNMSYEDFLAWLARAAEHQGFR